VTSIFVDGSGNVHTTGHFAGTADFDPGASTFNLTSAGSVDVFVSKLDSSGNFVWAVRWGGTSNDQGNSIILDGSGNVYTTGNFQGTVDFDPGAGTFNISNAGLNDVFVSKVDSSGGFVWAVKLGGTLTEQGKGISVDGLGNVYTTGNFSGTVDFDPSASTFNISAVGGDSFVSKLDPSGNFVWALKLGGTSFDEGLGIFVDGSGDVYTTGNFQDTADFDPRAGTFNLTSVGDSDVFVSKLDSSGGFVWAVRWGGTSADQGRGVFIDGSGNVYATGIFNSTVDFDPGAGTSNLTAAGGDDVFVSKLSQACVPTPTPTPTTTATPTNTPTPTFTPTATLTNTSTPTPSTGSLTIVKNAMPADGTDFQFNIASAFLLKWGTSGSGGGQFSSPWGIALDSAGNVYVADHQNHRIQKFDSDGTFLQQWGMNGSGDGQFNFPQGVALDSAGNIYVTDSNNQRIQKFNSSGVFLLKWGTNGSGNGQFSFPSGIAVDSAGNVYVSDTNNSRIQWSLPAQVGDEWVRGRPV
jgi:hypothetical protein